MAIEIYDINDLQAMNLILTENYVLMNDIDASDTINWNGGQGFVPIGGSTWATQFQGTLEGNGFKIINLYINRPSTNFQGLFGQTRNGSGFFVRNLGIENAYVNGGMRTGIIVANQLDTSGFIENCWTTGEVVSTAWAGGGGIAGHNDGIIRNCYSRATINAQSTSNGGIAANNAGTIEKCYFAGGFLGTGTRRGITSAGTVVDCFYDSTVASSGLGTPRTPTELRNVATYTQISPVLNDPWDFKNNPFNDNQNEDIWDISAAFNDGFPFFSYQGAQPSGNTLEASNITHNSARLNGELFEDGGNTINVFFRYRRVGQSWQSEISVASLSSPQEFFFDLHDLIPEASYENQAIFRWGEQEIFGNIFSFTTLEEPNDPEVETLPSSGVSATGATLNGRITSMGEASSVNVFFNYRIQGNPSWTNTVSGGTFTEAQDFSVIIDGLEENSVYEFRALVGWDGGGSIAETRTFYTAANASLYFLKRGVEIPEGHYVVFGEENTDGSWRLMKSGENLIKQKRISGNWITPPSDDDFLNRMFIELDDNDFDATANNSYFIESAYGQTYIANLDTLNWCRFIVSNDLTNNSPNRTFSIIVKKHSWGYGEIFNENGDELFSLSENFLYTYAIRDVNGDGNEVKHLSTRYDEAEGTSSGINFKSMSVGHDYAHYENGFLLSSDFLTASRTVLDDINIPYEGIYSYNLAPQNGDIEVNLPELKTNANRMIMLSKIIPQHKVTLKPHPGQLIDGRTEFIIDDVNFGMELFSSGFNWTIKSNKRDQDYKITKRSGNEFIYGNVLRLPFLIRTNGFVGNNFNNFITVLRDNEYLNFGTGWTFCPFNPYQTGLFNDRISIVAPDVNANYTIIYYEPKSKKNFKLKLDRTDGIKVTTSLPNRAFWQVNLNQVVTINNVEMLDGTNRYKLTYDRTNGSGTVDVFKNHANRLVSPDFPVGSNFPDGWTMEVFIGNNRQGLSSKGMNYRPHIVLGSNVWNFHIERPHVKRRPGRLTKGDFKIRFRNIFTNEVTEFNEMRLKFRTIGVKEYGNNNFKGYVVIPQLITL